jgi:hypothetical protein
MMEFHADIIKKSDQKPFGVQARRRLWYTFPGILNKKNATKKADIKLISRFRMIPALTEQFPSVNTSFLYSSEYRAYDIQL